MVKSFVPIFAAAAVLTGAFIAWSLAPSAPASRADDPAPKAQAQGSGAFDVVKMGRYGGRMGPVYFAHELHADLPGLDGRTITCSACHREACGSPRRCGECHVPTSRGTKAKLPST